ncbi:MAG: MiaB/RimO family radical SAM methylthiotransferase, partial [Candidatus Thermoplasmatota archaeon]|nr:MiaB/RimO family radical SAM methylthiotransferase [Candidatus Thermoplasmatota archaeon]
MTRRIVSFEPYGCTMNHGEARLAGQMLEEIGYEVRPPKGGLADPSSDIVLLFTCDVIETTQRRMWRRMEEITRDGKDLVVAGCLASIDGDRILERYPEAKILGSMGVPELCSSMNDLFSTGTAPGIDHPGPDGRMDTIVPIANGCLGSCSYCITRVARGPLRSYPVDKIIGRIRKGVLSGRKEVLLTSQDTGVYGLDIGGIDLGGLLS